jgi:hypothetical protein
MGNRGHLRQKRTSSEMTSDQLIARIIAIAEEHMGTPEAELEPILQQAWSQTGLLGFPTRGSGREFWRNLREDLLGRAAREKESVSVLTAMIAADVVQWASGEQISVDHYSYPIGLLVAWVTVGALKRNKDPDDPDSKKPR